jgi:hypothetical protein
MSKLFINGVFQYEVAESKWMHLVKIHKADKFWLNEGEIHLIIYTK